MHKQLFKRWGKQMIDKILKYVSEMEDYYHEKALEQKDWQSHMLMVAQATAFQKVRYFIEDLLEKGETNNES